jgi:uridine kinase
VTFRSRLDRRPGAANHYPADFLDALADRLRGLAQPGRTTLVAIDGCGCAGKTALCEGLLDRLEPQAAYLGIDEFFFAYPFPPLDPFPRAHLRWDEIERVVAELRASGAATFRPFDWVACEIGGPDRVAAPLVIVEGLFSLNPVLRPAYDFGIWVQGRLETRPARVTQRDGAHMVEFWKTEWDHREGAHFRALRPWDNADLVMAGAELPLVELGHEVASIGSTTG